MKDLSHSRNSFRYDFLHAVSELPPLPQIIHYEDDYDEIIRKIKPEDCRETIKINISGQTRTLNLLLIDERVRGLVRIYLLFSIQQHSMSHIVGLFSGLSNAESGDIEFACSSSPLDVQRKWPAFVAKYAANTALSIKWLISFLCRLNFMNWTADYVQFVSKALTVPNKAGYADVRSGDAFLSLEEESKLVRWFDYAVLKVDSLDLSAVEVACVLVSSYQFGMRPKQLGMVRIRDCTIRQSYEDQSVIVHLTFKMIKQKDSSLSNLPLVRKVKREWAPLFARLIALKPKEGRDSFLFGFKSRLELSGVLNGKLRKILGGDSDRTAYSLRHSLAQRMVDGGASHEELAAALGHSHLATGLVYFRQSANQVLAPTEN